MSWRGMTGFWSDPLLASPYVVQKTHSIWKGTPNLATCKNAKEESCWQSCGMLSGVADPLPVVLDNLKTDEWGQ